MTAMTDDSNIPMPVNDEEPSQDSMSRLWDALDAALDPPRPPVGSVGEFQCLRCGWRWDRRLPTVPKCCPNPCCRSTYWDRPPKTRRARRPEHTDLEAMRKRIARDAKATAKLKAQYRVQAKARALGLTITGVPLRPDRDNVPRMTITPRPTLDSATTHEGASVDSDQRSSGRIFRSTVPPPPGLDDLDTNTKG